jgi:uncharacterized protein (DUF302 family)
LPKKSGNQNFGERMTELGFQSTLNLPYETVLEKVTEALKAEGFGILTSIDVKETMKKKLDVDFRKYTILGACNPSLSYKALTARPDVVYCCHAMLLYTRKAMRPWLTSLTQCP